VDLESLNLGVVGGILGDWWRTGNRWLRVPAAILVGWPLLVMLVGVFGPAMEVKSAVALLPAIAAATVFVRWPLAAAAVAVGRRTAAAQAVLAVVGFESLVGVFFALVPIDVDRPLVPLFVLVVVTMGFFWLARIRWLVIALGVIAGAIALVFLSGGRKAIEAGQVFRPKRPREPAAAQAIVEPEHDGRVFYMGRWVFEVEQQDLRAEWNRIVRPYEDQWRGRQRFRDGEEDELHRSIMDDMRRDLRQAGLLVEVGEFPPGKAPKLKRAFPLAPEFPSRLAEEGETFYRNTVELDTPGSWSEVRLSSDPKGDGGASVDDQLILDISDPTGKSRHWSYDFYSGPWRKRGERDELPFEKRFFPTPGRFSVSVVLRDTAGGEVSSTAVWLVFMP